MKMNRIIAWMTAVCMLLLMAVPVLAEEAAP